MTQEETHVVSIGRQSLDTTAQIVLFEEARQSTEIVIQNNNLSKVSKQTRRKAVDMSEHLLPIASIADSYGSHLDPQHVENSHGLSTETVIQRQLTDGKNILAPPKRSMFIVKVFKEILSPFSLVLIIAGFLSILDVIIERTEASIPNIFLGLILFVVVFFNAFVTLFQERKGEKIIESFQQLQKNSCWVIRDETLQKVDSEELVNGDIVKISTGDLIPADLRCVSCSGLKVDNSTLTGESDPQSRSVENTAANPLEATNLLFFGTTVLEGLGYGIVIRTGNRTVMGNIAHLAGGQKEKKTPIRREIDRFVFILGTIAIVCCIVFFCVCMSFGFTWFQSFLFCIGVITGCIPAGLIATVTTCLSISAARLKEVNIVVKKLDHVETLGSVTVICSDKTGTLTQNKMTVVEAWIDSAIQSIQYNENVSIGGNTTQSLTTEDLLQRACSLCSSATFLENEANMNTPIMKRECLGDASEIALIKYVESRGKSSLKNIRKSYPELYCIPFNSKNKWMLTINDISSDDHALLLMKGAPERIANLCSKILISGVEHPMDEHWRSNFQDTYEFFASKGCRVLAFAQTTISKSNIPSGDVENVRDLVADNLTFMGMVALTDPPKVGVTEAVAKCKGANIQVVMVTGDHPITAKAIAKQVGIIEPNALILDEMEEQDYGSEARAIVIHGEQIDQLTDEDWKGIMQKKQLVFARTSPQQKLLIVSKFQEYGHIVAVTGDGTNDSPALKKADIGVAMNLSGSAVSKEAAALILLDDNFASIVNGIQEGRLIFDNLKKSLVYTVSHNLPEMTSFIAFMLFGIPVPMTGLQMICLDLGTEVASSICLAYEKAENDLMSIPPRKKSSALVGIPELIFCYLVSGLIESLGGIFCFIFTFAYYGVPPRYLWAARQGNYFQNTSSTPLLIEETGITLSGDAQNNILVTAQTSYFICIVMCQMVNMYTCRTRRDFIFTFPPFSNLFIYLGMVVAVSLSVLLVYCPFINDAIFGFRSVTVNSWFFPIPWMFVSR